MSVAPIAPPDVKALARHVRRLIRQHGLSVRWLPPSDGPSANKRYRCVRTHRVHDESDYFTALHEIGHVVGRGRSRPLIEAETNAWLYAIDVAIIPASSAVRREIAGCLLSYGPTRESLDAAVARLGLPPDELRYCQCRVPPADHPYWDLIEPRGALDRAARRRRSEPAIKRVVVKETGGGATRGTLH